MPPTIEVVRLVAVAAVVVATVAAAAAESPLIGELRVLANRYHEEPAHLDTVRAALSASVRTDPQLDTLVGPAEISFLWGDIRAKTADEKLQAYDQGRQAARRAIDLAPKSVVAHFWYGTTTARWGQ